MQWNNWTIGCTKASFKKEFKRSRYGKKTIYYLRPDGEIGNINVKSGVLGVQISEIIVEKSEAYIWLKRLSDWKTYNNKN